MSRSTNKTSCTYSSTKERRGRGRGRGRSWGLSLGGDKGVELLKYNIDRSSRAGSVTRQHHRLVPLLRMRLSQVIGEGFHRLFFRDIRVQTLLSKLGKLLVQVLLHIDDQVSTRVDTLITSHVSINKSPHTVGQHRSVRGNLSDFLRVKLGEDCTLRIVVVVHLTRSHSSNQFIGNLSLIVHTKAIERLDKILQLIFFFF